MTLDPGAREHGDHTSTIKANLNVARCDMLTHGQNAAPVTNIKCRHPRNELLAGPNPCRPRRLFVPLSLCVVVVVTACQSITIARRLYKPRRSGLLPHHHQTETIDDPYATIRVVASVVHSNEMQVQI